MLKSMELINFKCFYRQHINFRPLTLLTGINSAGKSSVIQALLLLQQNLSLICKEEERFKRDKLFCIDESQKLHLSGSLVNLGLPDDILHINADDDAFVIAMKGDDENISLKATLVGDDAQVKWNIFGYPVRRYLQYLNANRLGPQTLFPIPQAQQLQTNPVGNEGEFAAYQLHEYGQAKIIHTNLSEPNLLAPEAPGNSTVLQMQTEAWLSQLGVSVRIQTERPVGTDAIILRFSFPDISGNYYRPTNVGFGLTYALPIFVAALRAPVGSLLIVENPEAHLHPKGQALIGHFLARTAACGVQVIIETHSDHVLNGIRVAVKRAKIPHEDVQINFFHQHDGKSTISVPQIDRHGHIDQWPEDFFDEWDKQLSELL